MARVRDHAAEYRRRISAGLARGLTRSQARGHPSASAADVRGINRAPRHDPNLEAALKQLRKPGASLSKIAADAHVGRERLSRYVKAVAGAKHQGRAWTFNDQRLRRIGILTVGKADPVVIKVRGFDPARVAGLHAYEAGKVFDDDNDPDSSVEQRQRAFERRWKGMRIRDSTGHVHELSTDPNQFLRAIEMHDYSFEKFYAIESVGDRDE